MTSLKDIWQNREQILEGIKNNIFPKEEVEKIAVSRLAICKTCSYHSNNAKSRGYKTSRIDEHCTHCSCPLSTKTRSLKTSCPINLWGAIITDKEQLSLDIIEGTKHED